MVTQITKGISVSVETFYLDEQSNMLTGEYAFAYRIKIVNEGVHTVKLMRRHWFIVDTNGSVREVDGEGVVGEQPLLEPAQEFTYTSAASIKSDMGRMYGYYIMHNLSTNETLKVAIPSFELVPFFKYN
jgi:ApaG protein